MQPAPPFSHPHCKYSGPAEFHWPAVFAAPPSTTLCHTPDGTPQENRSGLRTVQRPAREHPRPGVGIRHKEPIRVVEFHRVSESTQAQVGRCFGRAIGQIAPHAAPQCPWTQSPPVLAARTPSARTTQSQENVRNRSDSPAKIGYNGEEWTPICHVGQSGEGHESSVDVGMGRARTTFHDR